MAPLALVLFLVLPAAAETDAEARAREAAALSRAAAAAPDPAAARARASAAFDGEILPDDPTVSASENQRRKRLRLARAEELKRKPVATPPAPGGETPKSKLSNGLILGGGAALGALQGFFSAGLIGAAAGGVLGLGAAWLYTQGHHAAAFGATAGGIIGAAFGGPIGGLIGAVVGAGVGFLIGKLFGI